MLIELCDDLLDHLQAPTPDATLQAAIANLALGFREGNHAITGSHRLLAALQTLPSLSAADQQTYRQIKLRVQDSQMLRARLRVYVAVHAAGAPRRDGGGHFHVPYPFFARSARIQPVALLAEHDDDARVYRRVAESFAAQHQLPLAVQLEPVGGGGSTAREHLRRCAAAGMVLCIVDADRTWPGGPLGETARQAQSALDALNPKGVAEVFVLPVRMIENLLPEALVVAAFAGEPKNRRDTLDAIRDALRPHGPLGTAALAHHKLKSAWYLAQLLAEKEPGCRAHLEAFRAPLTCVPPPPRTAWCTDVCEAADPRRCRCLLVPGIDLLKPVSRFCESSDLSTLASLLFPAGAAWTPHWEEIAARVVSWGCAFKPPRV